MPANVLQLVSSRTVLQIYWRLDLYAFVYVSSLDVCYN
jgi:hypothetical protein